MVLFSSVQKDSSGGNFTIGFSHAQYCPEKGKLWTSVADNFTKIYAGGMAGQQVAAAPGFAQWQRWLQADFSVTRFKEIRNTCTYWCSTSIRLGYWCIARVMRLKNARREAVTITLEGERLDHRKVSRGTLCEKGRRFCR